MTEIKSKYSLKEKSMPLWFGITIFSIQLFLLIFLWIKIDKVDHHHNYAEPYHSHDIVNHKHEGHAENFHDHNEFIMIDLLVNNMNLESEKASKYHTHESNDINYDHDHDYDYAPTSHNHEASEIQDNSSFPKKIPYHTHLDINGYSTSEPFSF